MVAATSAGGIEIVVPFVNPDLALRFFTQNRNVNHLTLNLIDNRGTGRGLPAIYNNVIRAALAQDKWLFFVHEDFEVQGPFVDTSALNPEAIYGTFGVRMRGDIPVGFGKHFCSHKDGSDRTTVGEPISELTWVDTLDCQSILLHTRMLRTRPDLRFDENLTFDLYAEEFCINAQENYGLPVFAVPLAFQHYSYGIVSERYWRGVKHLAARYPDSAFPAPCSFIGGRAAELEAKFTYDVPANPADER